MRIIRPEGKERQVTVEEHSAYRVEPIVPGALLFGRNERIDTEEGSDSQFVCDETVVHPASCGHLVLRADHLVQCHHCGAATCAACRLQCAWCLRSLCSEHAKRWDGLLFCRHCRLVYIARNACLSLLDGVAFVVCGLVRIACHLLKALNDACKARW